MNYLDKEKWLPSYIELEENALKSVKCEKNLLVDAGPGAGKTELLAQKANFLIECGLLSQNKKVLAISFKKDAASNLKKRFDERNPGKTELFDSKTYDSFFKCIYDQFMNSLESKYVVNNYDIDTKDENNIVEYEKMYGVIKDRNDRNSMKKSINDSMNSKKISSFSSDEMKIFLNKTKNSQTPTLSFGNIASLTLEIICKNPYIKRALLETYQYVFLDEFQDTTNIQYTILKEIFLGGNSIITAVGDQNQRIMVWAGARETIFDDFKTDFNADYLELYMNHRSVPKLVDFQKEVYSILSSQKEIKKFKTDYDKGDIGLYEFLDENEEVNTIFDLISRIKESGVPLKDICILVKQTPEIICAKLIEKLNANSIYTRIENDYQDLLKENAIKILLSVLNLVAKGTDLESWEELDYFFKCTGNNYEPVVVDQKIQTIRKKYQTSNDIDDCINNVIDLIEPSNLRQVYAEYKVGNYLKNLIDKFKELFKKNYVSGDLVESINRIIGEKSIPVMTIHKSKGLEYNTVILVGLEDNMFWNFINQPDEDKCAFFVALSRAKENMYFTFTHSRIVKIRGQFFYKAQSHNNINEMYSLLLKYKKEW